MSESSPLLPNSFTSRHKHARTKVLVVAGAFLALTAVVVTLGLTGRLPGVEGPFEKGPEDAYERALWLLDRTSTPIIDGHIDLPEFTRVVYGNNISSFDLDGPLPQHVDIPRLRQGKVGGFFWSCFTECPKAPLLGEDDFLSPTNSVRDTLEQIDVSTLLIQKYSDTFHFSTTADDVRYAVSKGKIAALLGIEGAHQLGNSLASLRSYAALGVRYMTLTHSCNNAFADSAGIFNSVEPAHGGLSALGRELIGEMNRLGVIVDLSHVSDQTAEQALALTKAPVMWSHSSARRFVPGLQRNVPDRILQLVGKGENKVDGVIMINFAPYFVTPGGVNATLSIVADHIEHIANVTSKAHVGLGSDFDGIEAGPEGLEDVSTYPALIAELIKRGWEDKEIEALAGGNVLRILEGVERVAEELKGEKASMGAYSKRKDLKRKL
ncbi:membrane dipeptidase-domain-containing protein [Mrakia frigida]|uniref:dipeptidase n=1 Tax=Mrakia frigida TaxID=29902 RepID=UPI003FCBEF5E